MKPPPAVQANPIRVKAVTRSTVGTAKSVTADRLNQAVFCTAAALVGIGYSLLLPFEFTQRLAWTNWHYLDARLIAFSVAFGVAVGWIVTIQFHATRQLLRRRGGSAGAVGTVLGVIPSLLCCTPVVPSALGAAGLSGVSLARTSGRIQSFFALNQNAMLAASLSLVVAAGAWATHRAAHAECLDDDGCPTDAAGTETNNPTAQTGVLVGTGEWLPPTDYARSDR